MQGLSTTRPYSRGVRAFDVCGGPGPDRGKGQVAGAGDRTLVLGVMFP